MSASTMYVPNNTVVGLGVFNPCLGSIQSVTTDCGDGRGAAPVAVNTSSTTPAVVFLANTTGDLNLRTGDLANVISLNCDSARVLAAVGGSLAWIPTSSSLQMPGMWRVRMAAGSADGQLVSPSQPLTFTDVATGLVICVDPYGRLLLATPPLAPMCGGGGPGLNAAYFYFAPPPLTVSWSVPWWLSQSYPYWFYPVNGWWPSWWSPGAPNCPPWVQGCPGYRPVPTPPSNPCAGPGPKPWFCYNQPGHNPCWLPVGSRPSWCTPCESANPPSYCPPGSDVDPSGCKRSAGYTWCGKCCCQNWPGGDKYSTCRSGGPGPGPTPGPRPQPIPLPVKPIGSDVDSNGCKRSAGYTWCGKCCCQNWPGGDKYSSCHVTPLPSPPPPAGPIPRPMPGPTPRPMPGPIPTPIAPAPAGFRPGRGSVIGPVTPSLGGYLPSRGSVYDATAAL